MKHSLLKLFIFVGLVFGHVSFAQNSASQSDLQRQIEEVMKAREEMFRMLMDDSSFDDFDKRFEQIMKNFNQHSGFGLQQFDDPIVGEYDWIKTDTQKILKIKVKQVKDKPLDIKIENGMIRLKGDVESVQGEGPNAIRRKVSFQRAFSLPDDVDQTNPEFENKEGLLLIKFKLKRAGPTKKEAPAAPSIKDGTDRVPLAPGPQEVTI